MASALSRTEIFLALSPIFERSAREGWSRWAMAISGGVDSMALAHIMGTALTNGTIKGAHLDPEVITYTVDHGLRTGSAEEAAAVGRRMTQARFRHQILTIPWSTLGYSTKPQGLEPVEEKARYARDKVLSDACRNDEIDLLFTAHHLDDQIETTLLRMGWNSHLEGLAAMQCFSEKGTLQIAKPFLSIPKSRLVATCQAANVTWFEDLTNSDESIVRNGIRAELGRLDQDGQLEKEDLYGFSERLQHYRKVASAQLDAYLANNCSFTDQRATLRLQPGVKSAFLARIVTLCASRVVRQSQASDPSRVRHQLRPDQLAKVLDSMLERGRNRDRSSFRVANLYWTQVDHSTWQITKAE